MLHRRKGSAVLAGVITSLLLAGTAHAAAPTAGDDTIKAWPRGTTDVLANDTGTNVTVSANAQPAHGTATCAPLGGCLYKAEDGYIGTDGFTYTLRDADGIETTGTVNVQVVDSPAGSALAASDDDVATLAGSAITVHVLANDTGKAPLEASAPSAPSHGTASCDGTTCTYVPAAGFTGADGFHYTLGDAGSGSDTADVHVLVVPAGSHYALGSHGAGGPVAPGGTATWALGVSSVAQGLAGEELAALPLPQLDTGLSGPHALSGGLQTAKGWKADGTHAAAGSDALLGDAISEPFPKPLPPISTGTGGDGHVPILVGSKIFAFYHHSSPTSVSCIDRRTGTLCPGYPIPLTFNTSNIPGPAVVVGTRIYTHLWPFGNYSFSGGSGGSGGYSQTAPVGLYCWDASTNDTCGYHVLGRVTSNNPAGASPPVQVGKRIYMAGEGGKLYCLDPATDTPCATIDTGLDPAPAEYDAVTHGTRIYISRSSTAYNGTGGTVTCVDVATAANCPGWATPQTFSGHWNVVNQHDASGAANGVCVVGAGTADCVTDGGDPATPTHISPFVASLDDYYDVTQEAEAGTRTFFGSLVRGGVGCWDWSTGAPCAGANFSADGWVSQPYTAYGATWDGSCVVALGDSARAFTVDAAGNSPCASLSSGTGKRVVDLRDQRFDRTVGDAHWNAVTLGDVGSGELTSVNVAVRDAETGELLASGDLLGGAAPALAGASLGTVKDGSLDLTGIDPKAHPAVTLDATSTGPSDNPAWDDAIPPRLRLSWTSDPAQVGFATKATTDCSTPADATIGIASHLASPGDVVSSSLGLAQATGCGSAAKPVAAASVPRSCGGARLFNIHLRYKGSRVRSVTVTVNGKKQKVKALRPRPVVRIDLRKFKRATIKVKITIRTKSGKVLRGTRVYHPCTKKLPDRGFKY